MLDKIKDLIMKQNGYHRILISVILILFGLNATAQKLAIKTNMLYWCNGSTNLGVETVLSERLSLELSGSFNPVNKIGDDLSFNHVNGQVELRYWPSKTFERHFLGLQGIYANYDVKNINLFNTMKDKRYNGSLYGGGITYGYHWAIGERFGIETGLTAGYFSFKYDKYQTTDQTNLGKYKAWYLGITKVNLSLIYFLK
ncbi:MAG: hypothetical protein H6Q12_77 [Bacteroidetes bacterium]|nr:hypothetical protein [Bacteroidota bacterium]